MPDAAQFHANAPKGKPFPLPQGPVAVPHAAKEAMQRDAAFMYATEDIRDRLATVIGDEGEFMIDADRPVEVKSCRISEDAMQGLCTMIGDAPAELWVRDSLPPGEALQERGLPEAA